MRELLSLDQSGLGTLVIIASKPDVDLLRPSPRSFATFVFHLWLRLHF